MHVPAADLSFERREDAKQGLRTLADQVRHGRAKEASIATRPRLHWEKYDWAVKMQRRIAVAMVRTAAWIATRAPGGPANRGG